MPATSLTLSYDALLSTTLFNYRKTLEDNIAQEFILYYTLKQNGGWKEVEDPGERAAFPLLYGLGTPDAYAGYDQLDTTPMDGITTAFFNWRQSAVPIAISGEEEIKNQGEARIIELLEAKIQQAEDGIKEWFSKAFLQGQGMNGGSIETAYVSPSLGRSFVDPLPLLVKKDPTTSTSIGEVNQSTNSWWRNQQKSSSASTFVAFRQELRNLYNTCRKGVGGAPDLHITDQTTFELYEQALEAMHQNPSYTRADLPFDTVNFRGKPSSWDENMVDVQNGTTNTDTKGTWYMLNTKKMGIKVVKRRNFMTTAFQKPENQDAKVAHILWMGASGVMNRRKQGVMYNIARTLT